jgi:hypothetical protein
MPSSTKIDAILATLEDIRRCASYMGMSSFARRSKVLTTALQSMIKMTEVRGLCLCLMQYSMMYLSVGLCCSTDEVEAAVTGERRTTETVVFSYPTKALDLLEAPLRMQG